MKLKMGINGFGRMGRLALRAGWHSGDLEVVQINETACDAVGNAHLLTFDSVHGRWDIGCDAAGGSMVIDGRTIPCTQNAAIADTDWSGCDLVVEATGRFRKPDQLETYFSQGVAKVLVAAPVEGALNIVRGVNDHLYDGDKHNLVTAASCTTNCLAPLVKVMHEQVGIVHGTITTIHDITNTQTVIDRGHQDLRRARASSLSLIPTTTGSARAIADIFPELEGRLNGVAVRVPLLNASLTDFVFEARRAVSAEEVNQLLKDAADGDLSGVLGFEDRPLVSVDYRGDPRSSVVDGLSTMVVDGTHVKLLAWYDNEWGYANRMVEIAQMIASDFKAA